MPTLRVFAAVPSSLAKLYFIAQVVVDVAALVMNPPLVPSNVSDELYPYTPTVIEPPPTLALWDILPPTPTMDLLRMLLQMDQI